MATVTRTFSQFTSNIKATHTGICVVGGALSLSVTFSPSGIMNMVQVPNHATLVDFYLRIQQGGAAQVVRIGTSATNSGIMSKTTLSQTISFSASISLDTLQYNVNNPGYIRAPGGTQGVADGTTDLMPVRISLSDDAAPASVWIQGRLATAISASGFFTFVLFYTMDGLPGHTTIR